MEDIQLTNPLSSVDRAKYLNQLNSQIQSHGAVTNEFLETLLAVTQDDAIRRINEVDGAATPQNVVIVNSVDDLPDAVGGVRTLADNTIYHCAGVVNIGSDRLEVGANTTIRGNSPATDYIISTTTGALITSNANNFRLVELGFNASNGTIFDLNGDGSNISLNIGVRFFGTGALGDIEGFDLFEVNIGLFVGFTEGFTLTGANGSLIFIDTEFFQVSGTPTSIDLGTSTFNLIRVLGCSFNVVDGGQGIVVAEDGANLNSGKVGSVSSSVFTTTGSGVATVGLSPLDLQWSVSDDNVGIVTSDRKAPTGWAFYSDEELSDQTFDGTPAVLTIDGGGSILNQYLPNSIRMTSDELWDVVENKITPISIGDSYQIRLTMELISSSSNPTRADIVLDIGDQPGISNAIVTRSITLKNANPQTISVSFNIFTLTTFLANGGRFFISANSGSITVRARDILINRLSSGAS